MAIDDELGWLLRVLSSNVRRSIIRSLSKGKGSYSELIREDPVHKASPGVFNFHLNKLMDLDIVRKSDEHYELTEKGRLTANCLAHIESDFTRIVGDRSMKKDGIDWRPWEQVRCQVGWAKEHAPREPLATLGMTVLYLDGMYEILSYPHGLELSVKRVMTNLKEVAEREKEPEIFELSLQLSAIKGGDLVEYESSVEGLRETIEYVQASPRWLELLPKRLEAKEARETPDGWRRWMDRTKGLAKEGRIHDALYLTRWTAFGVIGIYAEGIPQRTRTWRDTFIDTLIEIGQVDPRVKQSYMQAFGLEDYSVEDSMGLVGILDRHLALSRGIMARHNIEDLTQTEG